MKGGLKVDIGDDLSAKTGKYAETEDTAKNLYLTFEIGGEDYSIAVTSVKEIILYTAITIVPQTEEFVKGIINLRGDIIPVVSVRKRFGLPELEPDAETCIVVIFYEDYSIGLLVDCVRGVMSIPEEQISSPPSAHLSYVNAFIKNIGKTEDGIRLLLDLDKLLQ